jgi:hypothetical protein
MASFGRTFKRFCKAFVGLVSSKSGSSSGSGQGIGVLFGGQGVRMNNSNVVFSGSYVTLP